MAKKILRFKEIVEASDNVVFLGGAGVSTESGIPDFRSVDGLYNQSYKYPPEKILSKSFFLNETEEFFRFYREKMIHTKAKPSTTHNILANLEKQGKLKAVITQNIDGLHQMAGSKNVIELHGTIHSNHCMLCGKHFDLEYICNTEGIPKCKCGGIIKPDVVLYEEGLNEQDIKNAIEAVKNAKVLIVGGTSLVVQPAAGLINLYKGDKLILINKSATAYDRKADLLINDYLGKVFGVLEDDI